MGAIHQHWLNRTAEIPYPIDDMATCVDDAGQRLPPDLIADLNLRWPDTLGHYAFVAAASVTPGLVSLVIRAATGPDDAVGSGPLAVIAIPRPVTIGRGYAFQAQAAGVAGWIVFGDGANNAYQGRFSGPVQSRLTARAARSYRLPPVTGLRAATAAIALTGVVALKADPPLEITHETREIDGVVRDCAVIRLVEDATGQTSVFEQFAGPCAGRPESNTCGDPQPIQYVNGVTADCNGVLTLEFTGCAAVTQLQGGAGTAVDCGLGLGVACLPPALPNSAGLLPNEYPPILLPIDSGTSAGLTPDVHLPAPFNLPFLDCFTAGVPGDIEIETGIWEWTSDPSPTVCGSASISYSESVSGSVSYPVSAGEHWVGGSYEAQSAASRNVVIWTSGNGSNKRTVVADVKLLPGPVGAKHNAQIVLNYKPHPTLPGQVIYFAVTLDYDTRALSIKRFSGTTFVTLVDVPLPEILFDTWYTLTATVVPGEEDGQTIITALAQLTTGPFLGSVVTTTVAYAPSNGRIGLGTDHAVARFGFLSIDLGA